MALTSKQLAALRMTPPDADTGNRLRQAAKLAGLTQVEIAAGANVVQPYVSAVMRGRHATITVDNARKFAEFFGCHIEDLFPAREEVAAHGR